MPGFNLHSIKIDNQSYDFDGLTVNKTHESQRLNLSVQHPKDYPFYFDEKGNVYSEGIIYNDEIEEVAETIAQHIHNEEFDQIASVLLPLDGEFVFIISEPSKRRIYVINDRWGRLPVYYSANNSGYVVSRNISFITNNTTTTLNKEEVACSLLLGLNLGENTHWNEIKRMPPHCILDIDQETNTIQLHRFFEINSVSGTAPLEDVASEITNELTQALDNRIAKLSNPSLSLSGGLDSRLTLAVLKTLNQSMPLITYLRPNESHDKMDVFSAKKITSALDLSKNHEITTLPEASFEDSKQLIQFKKGLNCASMGYILPYHRMHETRGISSITDDGAGKFFRDLHPFQKLSSMKQLIAYVVKQHGSSSIKNSADICGLSEKKLKSYLADRFNSYPVASFNDKYAYFYIRDVGINWSYEGGDRNRQFTWITTPFYNPKVIELCLSLSQADKRHGRLFNVLFKKFPGNLEEIINPNWNQSVENEKTIKKLYDKQRLKSRIPSFLLDMKKRIPLDHFIFNKELKILIEADSQEFDLSKIKKKHSNSFYWQLLTLLLLMRD